MKETRIKVPQYNSHVTIELLSGLIVLEKVWFSVGMYGRKSRTPFNLTGLISGGHEYFYVVDCAQMVKHLSSMTLSRHCLYTCISQISFVLSW
jgi:hypothetical protein